MSRDLDVETARPLIAAYDNEIRSLASEYLKEPESDRDDWLHETIDGHSFVIYTWKARCVLICTDNPDAYEEDFGDKPGTVEAAAYAAMMRDVREMADSLADSDTGEDEPLCSECSENVALTGEDYCAGCKAHHAPEEG